MNYKIIDNFLLKKHFDYLSNLNLKKVEPNSINIYHNKIYKNGAVYSECIPKDYLIEMDKTYQNILINMLTEMYPEKVPFYEYSAFHIINAGLEYSYPIHLDDPNKLLSGVVYLSPKSNRGTTIYKNKFGDESREIEWRQNRAMFFSRKQNQTWHSYESDKKNNRLTLVYNLMTNDTKGVCEVEKINYYKQRSIEFLNPYIYRFFKKLI